ncbi:hypothetical protein BKA61DRAFT_622222, partial [Leptodontidium sp. MPI-SDFR-AT-0119]
TTMSKLSSSLKALIGASFTRPNTLPATPRIRLVYERLRQEALNDADLDRCDHDHELARIVNGTELLANKLMLFFRGSSSLYHSIVSYWNGCDDCLRTCRCFEE